MTEEGTGALRKRRKSDHIATVASPTLPVLFTPKTKLGREALIWPEIGSLEKGHAKEIKAIY